MQVIRTVKIPGGWDQGHYGIELLLKFGLLNVQFQSCQVECFLSICDRDLGQHGGQRRSQSLGERRHLFYCYRETMLYEM